MTAYTSAQRKLLVDRIYDMIEDHRLREAYIRPVASAMSIPGLGERIRADIADNHMDLDRLLFYLTEERKITPTQFLLLWSFAHSEAWIVRRRLDRDNLLKIGEMVKERSPNIRLTREELEGWALYHKVSLWLDVPMAMFANMQDYVQHLGMFDESASLLWANVGDVLCKEQPIRLKHTLEKWFLNTATNRLEMLTQVMAQQRLSSAELATQIDAFTPIDDKLSPLFERVRQQLHAQLLDAEPVAQKLGKKQLKDLYATSAWEQLFDTRLVQAECGGTANVTHTILDLNDEHFRISCDCTHNPHRACPIKIDAMRRFLDLLRTGEKPPSKHDLQLLDGLRRTLGTPAWQRQLDYLFEEMDAAPLIPDELDEMPCWFGWCIRQSSYGDDFDLYPALIRPKKRGQGVISKKLDLCEEDLDEIEDQAERHRLERWLLLSEFVADRTSGTYLSLLLDLANHPHVYVYENVTYPCTIRVDEIKLHMGRAHDDSLRFEVMAADRILSESETREILSPAFLDSGILLERFRIHEESAELVFYTADKKARRLLSKVPLGGTNLPSKSAGYILDKLSARPQVQEHIELARELRGEEVSGDHHLIVRLSMLQGVLSLGMRVEPIKGSVTHHPGGGPKTVYAMREGVPFYTERDLEAEVQRARRIITKLDLDYSAGDLMSWGIDDPELALDLIEQVRALDEADPKLDVVWDSSPPRLMGTAGVQRLELKVSLKQRLLELGGEVKVEQHTQGVSIVQLLEAAREHRRWIEISDDHWLKLDESLQKSLSQLAHLSETSKRGASMSMMAAPVLEELMERGVQVEGPPKWLSMVEEIRAARTLEVQIPEALEATLRPYQVEGVKWMMRLSSWAPGACLADDMGLGKTVQAIALLLARVEEGPALVVAPTSLGFNWEDEIARFAPSLEVVRLRSKIDCEALSKKKTKKFYRSKVYITSYELMSRNVERFESVMWGTFVLDEAQAIKNSATNRAQAAHKIEARFKLAMTGTPLENHTGELWSLIRTIVPGLLGSQQKFRKRFQIPIERHEDANARDALARLISPFILRRVKREVARDLPERTDVKLLVELSTQEQKLYNELRDALLAKLNKTDRTTAAASFEEHNSRFDILAAITRLRQAACHPRLYHPHSNANSSKVAMLRDHLESIVEEGYAALVFSQFTSLLELVRQDLEGSGMRIAYLDGSLSVNRRQEVVRDFQDGKYDVFLLSIKAGGVGLNLTRASSVFLLDPWWNPAVEDQATDRAHRIGQEDPVTVYRLVSSGTIEEAIYALHEEKRSLFDGVMAMASDGKKGGNVLSVNELTELIMT